MTFRSLVKQHFVKYLEALYPNYSNSVTLAWVLCTPDVGTSGLCVLVLILVLMRSVQNAFVFIVLPLLVVSHKWKDMQNFTSGFFSLSVTSLRSIRVVPVSFVRSFLLLSCVTLHEHPHIVSVQSPVEGPLSCFQILANIN